MKPSRIAHAPLRGPPNPHTKRTHPMRQRPFGKLGAVSALTLGGGGVAQIWGADDP